MTDFSPLESALYDATPERIAGALRYLRKADAVMAALMPLSANTPAQQPAAAVPVGWRVMRFTGTFKRGSERWEIYDPEGNGGTVDENDVLDDDVKRLLDALAAAERKGES